MDNKLNTREEFNSKNYAFIDGQNLYMGTRCANPSWNIDLPRFRKYLLYKYNINKAYYFIGYAMDKNSNLYDEIIKSGFILKFKKHNPLMNSTKKGNVDIDIIFFIMKKLYLAEAFDNVLLVSGDGDYRILIDFLINENRFMKILFPNIKFASSLYKELGKKYFAHLENKDVKRKIAMIDESRDISFL